MSDSISLDAIPHSEAVRRFEEASKDPKVRAFQDMMLKQAEQTRRRYGRPAPVFLQIPDPYLPLHSRSQGLENAEPSRPKKKKSAPIEDPAPRKFYSFINSQGQTIYVEQRGHMNCGTCR